MKRRNKIAILTPFYYQNRGNSTTAKRIKFGLERLGYHVVVFSYNEEALTDEKLTQIQSADVIHIIHFSRFSSWYKNQEFKLKTPYILTSGGTDINIDMDHLHLKQEMYNILKEASAITVFTVDGKKRISESYPDLIKKIFVIPQSVWFEENNTKKEISIEGFPKILLPAGLRPVKDVFFVFNELQRLQEKYPLLHFLIIGPVLDNKIGEEVNLYHYKYPWFHFIEDVSFSQMKSYYEWSDIVINTSISEGQSSSIIEAMSLLKPVIVRSNEGNNSIITDEIDGFIFETPTEFYHKIVLLIEDMTLKQRITKNAINKITQHFCMEEEIKMYIDLYEKQFSGQIKA